MIPFQRRDNSDRIVGMGTVQGLWNENRVLDIITVSNNRTFSVTDERLRDVKQ